MSDEFKVSFGSIPLADIHVDEGLWGEGAEVEVLDWLVNKYDPERMPALAVTTIREESGEIREGYWLIGWEHQGTEFKPLLTTIFGEDYATVQLARQEIGASATTAVLCPRCNLSFYTPYGAEGNREIASPPALSRLTRNVPEEDKLFVCSWCGSDEAMEEATRGYATPQSEWPVFRPGPFGQGVKS